MDPITLLATASAIWSGLKKAAEKAFWDNLILWIGGNTVIVIGGMVIYATIMAIINRGV